VLHEKHFILIYHHTIYIDNWVQGTDFILMSEIQITIYMALPVWNPFVVPTQRISSLQPVHDFIFDEIPNNLFMALLYFIFKGVDADFSIFYNSLKL